MNRTLSACLLAAFACLAPAARGGILFERSLVVDRSVNIFSTSQFDLEFILGDAFFTPSNPVKLFDDVSLTRASIGDVFIANSTNDPDFQSVADRLSDGNDEYIRLVLEESASGRKEQRGWRESGFFVGHGSTLDPDLAGVMIDGVQLRIDAFVLHSGSVASLAPAGPPVQVQMTFTVLGTAVPEPATLGLGAVGLAMLVGAGYTRRR